MSKFKVGDEVAIAAVVKITGIQNCATGAVTYQTDRGFCIHEVLMDEIALSAKPTERLMGREEPKPTTQPAPKFKVGDRVKTEYDVGTIVEIQHDDMPFLVLHDTWNEGHNAKAFAPHLRLTGERSEWFEERDITLIPNESPVPEPKYYTGKVFCAGCETGSEWAYKDLIGRVFRVNNGKAEWLSFDSGYVSFEDVKNRNASGRWFEVKE